MNRVPGTSTGAGVGPRIVPGPATLPVYPMQTAPGGPSMGNDLQCHQTAPKVPCTPGRR